MSTYPQYKTTYTLEGQYLSTGVWRPICDERSLSMVQEMLEDYRSWMALPDTKHNWKDFRIIKITKIPEVIDPSAPPVADGPAGFSDTERLDWLASNDADTTCNSGSGDQACEWAVRVWMKPADAPRVFWKPSLRAAIDEAIRAARKGV